MGSNGFIQPVRSGDRVTLGAGFMNALIDVANTNQKVGGVGDEPILYADRILVKNPTEDVLPVGSIFGIGDYLSKVDDAVSTEDTGLFRNGYVPFYGEVPTVEAHENRFCVILGNVDNSDMVEAQVIGLASCYIDVTDESHTYATVKEGDITQLASATTGSALILWKESGTGTKLARILLGGGGGGGVSTPAKFLIDLQLVTPWEIKDDCIGLGHYIPAYSGDVGVTLPGDQTYLSKSRLTVSTSPRNYDYRPTWTEGQFRLNLNAMRCGTHSGPNFATVEMSDIVETSIPYGYTYLCDSIRQASNVSTMETICQGLSGFSASNSYTLQYLPYFNEGLFNSPRNIYYLFGRISGVGVGATINIYKHPRMDAADLVGHGTFVSYLTYIRTSIIADNSSGLSGMIYIKEGFGNADYVVFEKHDAGTMTNARGTASGCAPHPIQLMVDLLDAEDIAPPTIDYEAVRDYSGRWLCGEWSGYIYVNRVNVSGVDTDYYFPGQPATDVLDRWTRYDGLLLQANECGVEYYDDDYDPNAPGIQPPENMPCFSGYATSAIPEGHYGWLECEATCAMPSKIMVKGGSSTPLGLSWDAKTTYILPRTGPFEYGIFIDDSHYIAVMFGFQPTRGTIARSRVRVHVKQVLTLTSTWQDFYMTPTYLPPPIKGVVSAGDDKIFPNYPIVYMQDGTKYYRSFPLSSILYDSYSANVNNCAYDTSNDITSCRNWHPNYISYHFLASEYIRTVTVHYDSITDAWVVDSNVLENYGMTPAHDWEENDDHTFTKVIVDTDTYTPYPTTIPADIYRYECTYDEETEAWGDVTYIDVDTRRDPIDWTAITEGSLTYYKNTTSATIPEKPTFVP